MPAAPIWQGELLKELLRRGTLGEDFRAIAGDYHTGAALAEMRWSQYASPELKAMRRERRRIAHPARASISKDGPPIPPTPPLGGRPKSDPFAGQCFTDDPKAASNRGSPWMPSQAVRRSWSSMEFAA